MAFTASLQLNVRTDGDDTNNGGGFDPGSCTFSTNLAATNGNTDSPVVTSASYNFVAGDVNAWVYVASGTNWIAGWYQIVSVAANAATLDAAIGHAILSAGGLNTVSGCATVASPTSGSWSVDYSKQASAQFTYTDLVINAGTNTDVTSAAFPFGVNHVGNLISVTSGTGFTVQRVQIRSIPSGTTARCDKSLGTLGSTGGNGKQGGALATPGKAGGLAVSGADTHIKSGTYSITSASANVAGGCFTCQVDSNIIGYGTRFFDYGTRPLLQASGISTFTIVTIGTGQIAINMEVDGAGLTSSRGFSGGIAYRCKASNCTNNGFTSICFFCLATGCSTQPAFVTAHAYGCEASANTVTGFQASTTSRWTKCVSYGNTGASSNGFAANTNNIYLEQCLAHSNGQHGFSISGASGIQSSVINCMAISNTGTGFLISASSVNCIFTNNAAYNNSTNFSTNFIYAVGSITLTADPCVNAAGGDYSLTTVAGGGGSARGAGYETFIGGSIGYPDVGALQHRGRELLVNSGMTGGIRG